MAPQVRAKEHALERLKATARLFPAMLSCNSHGWFRGAWLGCSRVPRMCLSRARELLGTVKHPRTHRLAPEARGRTRDARHLPFAQGTLRPWVEFTGPAVVGSAGTPRRDRRSMPS